MQWYNAICDVCRLIDGDLTYKMCVYCSMCDSNICEADYSNKARRLHAMVLRKWEKTRGLFA